MRLLWLYLLSACGRVAFDQRTDGGVATGDGRPPSLCAGQSVLLCDGFESSAFDARWMQQATGGTVAIDHARAYRGASSFHVHLNAATSENHPTASVSTFDGLSGVTAVVHARVWAYFASPYTPEFSQVVVFTSGTVGVAFGTSNAKLMLNDFSGGMITESATAVPLDRWVCLTYALPVNRTGLLETVVDGQEIGDLSKAKPAAVAFDRIWLGLDLPTNGVTIPATDAWFDELIVDDAPVTCAQ